MLRGRCIEHGLAIGPDGGCVLCRRERGVDSKPAGDLSAGASPSSKSFRDEPASSLSPAVMRSVRPSAPPSKPIVIPSLHPDDGDPVVVRVPPALLVAFGVVVLAGVAFGWSHVAKQTNLFPQPAAPVQPAATPRLGVLPRRTLAVTMYSGSPCVACGDARAYLNGSRISFVEWDVDRDAEARARYETLSAARILPTFDVGGTIVEGFEPSKLEAALRAPESR